ncbi:MAG: nitroreductase family protein [Candidatus Bathyarchaeia archaeon]|nr:nitroreductase family protein [Candidatus Bathyarchaeota archaeon]
MSDLDVILTRRSIRRYETRDIPQDVLENIFEAGRQSPSAVNKQPIRFIAVTDKELKKIFSDALFNRFIKDAPVVLVGCADVGALLTGKWAVVDTCIALENMVIAAWSLGVGSCWIGAFNEEKIKKLLNIPERWKIVALVTFGYPAEQPRPRKKKKIEELFSFNNF